ncbi:MAG: guanylate kinase [Parachlamydiaceae bacterium]|nr:guanylate kinase [Parachlamydiaceae bacterium]
MLSLLAPLKQGLCFILSAPAGTGKTTLVNLLMKEFPNVIASISFTTRSPRMGEINGKDYHFITEQEFNEKIAASDFLEYVKLYGNYYGSSRQWINEQRNQGKHVFLVIDTQGAIQLKGKFESTSIFVSPPSIEVLANRLGNRKTETSEMIEKRLDWARKEMEFRDAYDYQLINDDLSNAYQILRSIVIAETHRVKRDK